MIAAMWDILQLTSLWDVDHCSYVSLSLSLQTWDKAPKKGTWFMPETELKRRDDLLHSESWEEFQMIILWERRSAELDVPVAEHKVNMWNPKVLGASSWEQKWRWCISLLWAAELTRNSKWLSCVMQWERRSVEWTCLWMSTSERVKIWFFCVMQRAKDMTFLWMCP